MYPFSRDGGGKTATGVRRWARPVLVGLGAAALVQAILWQPFSVTAVSMEPNLVRGDYIIVSKFAYGWSRHALPFSPPLFRGRVHGVAPRRGDIIVFKLPRDGATDYAQRLIGLPGDRVQIAGGIVWVNGRPFGQRLLPEIDEDHRKGIRRVLETNAEGRQYVIYTKNCDNVMDNTPVYQVPWDSYFFLGDNRENALDSRFNARFGVGFVPADNLEGRAELGLFSWTERASFIDVRSWITEARFDRFFSPLH